MADSAGTHWANIVAITEARRSDRAPAIAGMIAVRDRYNADWVLPMPDVPNQPTLPPIGPALIAESIDTTALMAASVRPNFFCPPLNPANDTGVRSHEYAGIRRKVLYATHHASGGNLIRRRGYRHLQAYATACMIVRPDYTLGHPVIEIRDPLGVYPDPKAPEDLSPPRNMATMYQRSATWLRDTYPKSRQEVGGPVGPPGGGDELWDLVEWFDEECCVIGILGPCSATQGSAAWMRRTNYGMATVHGDHGGPISSMELHRWIKPRPTPGRCDAVSMSRVTLDKIASNLKHQLGNIDLMTNLLALAIVSEEKAVFADKYAVGAEGRTPSIVTHGGVWQDGRSGNINLLQDVQQVGAMQQGVGSGTIQMIQMLERDMRVSSGLPSLLTGEGGSYATRTGRGIDAFMGVSVDPRVQEAQEIFEIGLTHLNAIVLEQYLDYWPDDKKVMVTGWSGLSGLVEFVPTRHIEASHNVVKYPMLGMDAQGLTVTLGQMVAAGIISTATARQLHPYVDDPDLESRLAVEEMLERAATDALLTQAAQGGDPVRLSYIHDELRKPGVDILTAIKNADETLRKQQATAAPPTPEGMAAPPELMPGLGAEPGAPLMQPPTAEATPAISGPNPNQQNLSALMDALAS